MNRPRLLLALVALFAGVAFVYLRREGGAAERFPASQAAELAPANTLAFVQLPDLERTAVRWEKSDLRAVLQRVQSGDARGKWEYILAMWMAKAGPAQPQHELMLRLLQNVGRMELAGGYLAVTDFRSAPLPKLVIGLPYRAKRSVAGSALEAMKSELFALWPGAKSELSKHGGIEIETITSATPVQWPIDRWDWTRGSGGWPWTLEFGAIEATETSEAQAELADSAGALSPEPPLPLPAVHLALRDDWLFVSTDRALLTATLDRYLKPSGAAENLTKNPSFVECGKHALAEPDFLAWETREAAMRNERHLDSKLRPFWTGTELKALSYTWRLEEAGHARVYAQFAKSPEALFPTARQRLTLTSTAMGSGSGQYEIAITEKSEQSLVPDPSVASYGVIDLPKIFGEEPVWSFTPHASLAFVRKTQFEGDPEKAAFGPNLTTLLVQDSERAMRQVFALEVRNAKAAEEFGNELGPEKYYSRTAPRQRGEVMWWNLNRQGAETMPGGRQGGPTCILLTNHHLLWGDSQAAVFEMARRSTQIARKETNRAVGPNERGGPSANSVYFYVDTPAVVRGGGFPWHAFPGLLPSPLFDILPRPIDVLPGTFAPHLHPGTIQIRIDGAGWLFDSTAGLIGDAIAEQMLEPLPRP